MPANAFAMINRQAVRAPVNTMDKCTVVSIYPKAIHEIKHTTQPSIYNIPAGSFLKPETLVVGPCSWWRELDANQPLIEVTNSSIQVADAIVKDYCNGLVACDMGGSQPGLFYIEGSHDSGSIIKNFKPQLDLAKARQHKWYQNLVQLADVLWVRSLRNPLSIGDDMRLAAQELQLMDKEWLKDQTTLQLVNCPACGTLRNDDFPVCQHCKAVIDKKKFDSLGLSFAS